MQREVNALMESLREFVAQPDYPSMIITGSDTEVAFPHRILSSFDRQDEDNYYLLFPFPCPSAAQYFNQILSSVQMQLEAFSQELQALGNEPPPELPAEVLDERQPLKDRLRSLALFLGAHLPGGNAIVWGLIPSDFGDPHGYRGLVEHLLALEDVPAWMNRHRFLLRDAHHPQPIVDELRSMKNDRVLVLDLDLSNERVGSSLIETAQDRSAPPDDRMMAFFQLAAIDMAFQRYPQSVEKYGVCFNYYQQQGNETMQALSLTGAGDVLRQSGDPTTALERYQQSLALSVPSKNLALIRPGMYGAGLSCLDLQRPKEAEGYLQYANAVSGKMNDPFAKCDALEQIGIARQRQSKVEGAVESWVTGRELAKQFEYKERLDAITERLQQICQEYGLQERAAEFSRELAQRRESEQHRLAHATPDQVIEQPAADPQAAALAPSGEAPS